MKAKRDQREQAEGARAPTLVPDERLVELHQLGTTLAAFQKTDNPRVTLNGVPVTLDQQLPIVLQSLCSLLGTEAAAVLRLSQDGTALYRQASVGMRREHAVAYRVGIGVEGRIVAAARTLHFDDLGEVDGLSASLRESGLRSLVGAPLRIEGQIAGVVYTGNREPGTFTPNDLLLLELIVERIGAAMGQVQLHESQRRLARKLANISKASVRLSGLVIAAEADLQPVLSLIVREAKRVTGADYVALGVGGASGARFDPWIQAGMSEQRACRIGRPPHALGLLGRVACESRSIRIADLRTDPAFIGFPGHHPEMGAFVGVPIRYHGRSVGTLFLAKKPGKSDFTAADQGVAEILAAHAGVAIETARLYGALSAERRRSMFLADASAELSQSLDYEETLRTLARKAVATVAEGCVITLLGTDGKSIRRVAISCADPAKEEFLRKVLSFSETLEENHPVLRVLRTGHPEILDDSQGSLLDELGLKAVPREAARRLGLVEVLIVPIFMREQRLGTITLGVSVPGRFGPDEVTLAVELARRAAFALDNANLYQKTCAAVRSRDALMATVSHDLANPLNTIQIGTELLATTAGSSGVPKYVELVRRSVTRMKRLVRDLLDITSLEAGHLSIAKRPEAVRAIVDDAVHVFQLTATEKELTLQKQLPAVELHVCCDRERIIQVLNNLLSNAIKFTGKQGAITVTVTPWEADMVRFSVADTGSGIPEKDLPRVFEWYWQAQETAKLGTGLGLSIAKGVVEAHGGQIWVESRVGEGATFFFTLPLSSALPEHPTPAATQLLSV